MSTYYSSDLIREELLQYISVSLNAMQHINTTLIYNPQIKCFDSTTVLTRQFDCGHIRGKLVVNYIFCLLSAKLHVGKSIDVTRQMVLYFFYPFTYVLSL